MRSLSNILRGPRRRRDAEEEQGINLEGHETRILLNRLFVLLSGDHEPVVNEPTIGQSWFLSYLESSLSVLNDNLRKVLATDEHETSIIVPFLRILNACAINFKSEKDLALEEMFEDLVPSNLRSMLDMSNPDLAYQLLFICFGLLSGLYMPEPKPAASHLEMQKLCKVSPSKTWTYVPYMIKDLDQPFATVLSMLCEGDNNPLFKRPSDVNERPTPIFSSNLNYYTLTRMAGIKIVFTGSACEHLEFDLRSRQLRIFCHPSICFLLCEQMPRGNFLEMFFVNCLKQEEPMHANNTGLDAAVRFYHEIIYTYLLLFGQDAKSLEVASSDKLLENALNPQVLSQASWLQSFKTFNPFRQNSVPISPIPSSSPDPLLVMLLTKSWSKLPSPVSRLLGGMVPKAVYPAQEDFPYFNFRLISLHEFVLSQTPSNIATLWQDRRDIGRFWTLWALLLFGSLGVFIGIIQIVLTLLQLIEAYQSRSQGP